MRTIVSSEKLPVTKVTVESEGRSDTLFAYGVESPAVMDVLKGAFGGAGGQPEDSTPVVPIRKRRMKRMPKAASSKAG